MRPPLIRSGRNPFQVSIIVGFLLVGIYSVIWSPPSVSLDRSLDPWERYLWSTLVLFGSCVSLWGLYWHNMLEGIRIERVGMFLMFIGSLTYFLVIRTESSFDRSGLIVTVDLSVMVASVWRGIQICTDLRRWRIANLPETGDTDA